MTNGLLLMCCIHLFLRLISDLYFAAIVGDITPSDGVPKLEKSKREREALEHMCKLLGGGPRGDLSFSSFFIGAFSFRSE